MPFISETQTGDIHLCAFLDMIAWSEGTSNALHSLTSMDGYDVIVTGVDGPEIFTDFRTHPFADGRAPKHITGTLFSSASGRYQFLRTHWLHYKNQLKLPDFGPLSQDLWAIQLIRERQALTDIKELRIREAISRCANIWASFPEAGYGQPEHKLDQLLVIFESALDKLKVSPPVTDGGEISQPEPVSISDEITKIAEDVRKIRQLIEMHFSHDE